MTSSPSPHPVRRPNASGYSLVELSIVIAIMAMIAGTALSEYSKRTEKEKIERAWTQLNALNKAIVKYSERTDTLPCPSPITLAPDNADFARSNDSCRSAPLTTVQGQVPTRTLGLPDRMAIDPWGSRIVYRVVRTLTTTGYDSDYQQINPSEVTTGIIQILDGNGNQVNAPNKQIVTAFVLVSHGPDREGGYNILGVRPHSCSTTTLDAENCNNDSVFRAMDITPSSTEEDYYFDLVKWVPMWFKAP